LHNVYNSSSHNKKMFELFAQIKSVGFDLDNTLYQNNPEIDGRIIAEIAKKILEHNPKLNNLENAKNLCDKLYEETGSRTQSLKNLGLQNAGEIVRQCMAQANFVDLIKPDKEAVQLIEDIHEKYFIFLITSTVSDMAIPRLNKIGLNEKLFDHTLFGESALPNKKIDGSIFSYFLERSRYLSNEHIYIGDNLKGDILPPKFLGMKTIAIGKKIPEANYSVEKIYDIRSLLL